MHCMYEWRVYSVLFLLYSHRWWYTSCPTQGIGSSPGFLPGNEQVVSVYYVCNGLQLCYRAAILERVWQWRKRNGSSALCSSLRYENNRYLQVIHTPSKLYLLGRARPVGHGGSLCFRPAHVTPESTPIISEVFTFFGSHGWNFKRHRCRSYCYNVWHSLKCTRAFFS